MAESTRTPRLPPEVRRQQLLDAALSLVAREGVAGLSVEAVAREAGVTRPVVYDHFGDLDGLAIALLDREEATALDSLGWITTTAAQTVPDPDAFLVAGLRSFLDAVAGAPRTWRIVLMPADGGTPLVRERITRSRGDVVARVQELLRWGLAARGGPVGLDETLLARVLVAIGEELARLVLTHPRRFSPARLTDACATLIALLPRESAAAPAVPEPSRALEAPAGASPAGPLPAVVLAAPPAAAPPVAAGDGPVRRVPMAERREQLLDAALALVGEEGFDGLTVDALARRVGVNRVIVYRAYASLVVLRLALLRREGAHIDAQLDALLPGPNDPRRADRLLADALDDFLLAVLQRPATWRLALLKPESAPVALQRLAGRRRSQLAARLVPLVAKGVRDLDEDVSGIDAEVLARLLLTCAEELGRETLEDPGERLRIRESFWGLIGPLRWASV